MNIDIIKPSPSDEWWYKSFGKHKAYIDRLIHTWEVVLSTEDDGHPDYVEFYQYVVRPTKRELRQAKRHFRKIVALEEARQKMYREQFKILDYEKVLKSSLQ